MSDNVMQPVFDVVWDAGVKFFTWLFDGYMQPKMDFIPLWNEIHLYNSIGNKPILLKENKTDRTHTYIFTIPVGMTINDFIKNKAAIAQYLHQDIKNIRIELINNMAAVTIYDTSKLSFDYRSYNFDFKGREIRIPIGINLKNFETVYWSPTNPNEAHILVGGSTRRW